MLHPSCHVPPLLALCASAHASCSSIIQQENKKLTCIPLSDPPTQAHVRCRDSRMAFRESQDLWIWRWKNAHQRPNQTRAGVRTVFHHVYWNREPFRFRLDTCTRDSVDSSFRSSSAITSLLACPLCRALQFCCLQCR